MQRILTSRKSELVSEERGLGWALVISLGQRRLLDELLDKGGQHCAWSSGDGTAGWRESASGSETVNVTPGASYSGQIGGERSLDALEDLERPDYLPRCLIEEKSVLGEEVGRLGRTWYWLSLGIQIPGSELTKARAEGLSLTWTVLNYTTCNRRHGQRIENLLS